MGQQTIDVELEGIAPLLQNNIEGSEEQIAGGNRKRRTIGAKDDSEEWKKKLYPIDGNGYLGHTSAAIESALQRAGRDFKGDKRRSLQDVVKAMVFAESEMMTLHHPSGKPYEKPDRVHRASVVNPHTKGRGFVYRPLFDTGWRARVKLVLQDDEILSVSQLKEVLDHAGVRIGIGDWRPKFGRFIVRQFLTPDSQ